MKKPMCLLPIAGQYEQIINAHYIEKLALGIAAEKLDQDTLARFLTQLENPIPDDPNILWPNNNKFFQILQNQLNKLDKPISIAIS